MAVLVPYNETVCWKREAYGNPSQHKEIQTNELENTKLLSGPGISQH